MLDKLIDSATSADDKSFFQLIRRAADLQGQERKDGVVGSAAVSGGLVKIRPGGRLILVGDLHGDLQSLATILKGSKFLDDPAGMIVFLGDYGDRGAESVEIYHVVLSLKAKFPERVILMRGNHEGPKDMAFFPHDLPDQIMERFGRAGDSIYGYLRILFDLMHHGVLVEGSYLILHGGVPTNFSAVDDIANAHRTHPETTYLEEILWNDPKEMKGTSPSARGYGRYFGKDITERALQVTDTNALIRAHEPCNGYRLNHDGLVLTLFSCKAPYGNTNASYLKLGEKDYSLDGEGLAKIVELI